MFRWKHFLTLVVLSPVMMGQTNNGCTDAPLPTVEQINLYLPKEIRTCPHAPKSPGRGATRRQTAKYIAELYNAWEICHGNVKDIDRLYRKWQSEVKKVNGGKCPPTLVCD